LKKWTLDAYAGVWLFTTNGEFYTGSSTRTQDPVVSIQAHTSFTVRPRLWVAFDATWYFGGTTTVDGISREDRGSNTRIGATLSLPLTRQQSLKFGYNKGATTRIGADFTTISGAWQLSWFD
jgi:hypothetical protein